MEYLFHLHGQAVRAEANGFYALAETLRMLIAKETKNQPEKVKSCH